LLLGKRKMKSFSWFNHGDLLVDFSDERLIRAWKKLPDKERLVLYLIDVEQISRKKVAEIMGIPVAAVGKQVDWARAELKRTLL
jgi:DNA-directed RNA polymerase specialized sigma24 family protein